MALDSSFLRQFEEQLTSRHSHQAYRATVKKRLGEVPGLSSFGNNKLPTELNTRQLFLDIVKASGDVDEQVVEAIRSLRQVGIKTAALTNDFRISVGTFSDDELKRLESLERLLLDKSLFDVMISSAATGSRKPERKYMHMRIRPFFTFPSGHVDLT